MEYAIETQVIDVAQREVRRQDACVPVEPKVFDLLLYLVENRARVVAKDELVERIWNGRAISDAALSSCVKAARRALGDDGQQQRFIRTINRRGFRFVGPVEAHDRAMLAADVQARSSKFGAAGAGEGTSLDAAAYDLDLTLPARPSVAVLPICALGDEDQQALVADGLTHDLTVRLARTRWLFVTARASAARYHASAFDPAEIGRRLGVRYLLGGSLRAAERRLRLTITLSDTAQSCEIWADPFRLRYRRHLRGSGRDRRPDRFGR